MRRQKVFTSPTLSILYLCLNTFFKLVFYAVIKYSLKKVYIFVFEITFCQSICTFAYNNFKIVFSQH